MTHIFQMGWFNHQPARLKMEPQNDTEMIPDDFSISPLVLQVPISWKSWSWNQRLGVSCGRVGLGSRVPSYKREGGFRKGNKNSQILKNLVGNVAQKRQKKGFQKLGDFFQCNGSSLKRLPPNRKCVIKSLCDLMLPMRWLFTLIIPNRDSHYKPWRRNSFFPPLTRTGCSSQHCSKLSDVQEYWITGKLEDHRNDGNLWF